MIKNFTPMPYEGINPLPDYVTGIRTYELVGTVPGGYVVTLGKLTVGGGQPAHPRHLRELQRPRHPPEGGENPRTPSVFGVFKGLVHRW